MVKMNGDEEKMIIYLDGEFVPEEEAKISVFDHGLLYGDGVFEGIRAYNGRVFRLTEHLVRLYNSAKAILLEIPLSFEEMEEAVLETLRRNKLQDAYIRLVVTRGKGDLGLDPKKCEKPTVFIITDSITLYPEETYQNGLKLVTVPTRRNAPEAINPNIKSLNYLNNILAKMEAAQAGAVEAIMLNNEGYVAECTGDNIFIIRGDKIETPSPALGGLPGITRDALIEVARKLGYTVEETFFTRYDLYTADECFLTGTAAEAIPVVELDGRKIGSGKPGPITQKLITAFRELANSEGTTIGE